MISPATTIALNSLTYTEITFSTDGFIYASYYAEDNNEFVSFYVANDSSGTNEHKIVTPIAEYIKVVGGTAFYAKSISGTPNLIIKGGISK